ncbi:MAG: hypothetical protein IPH32_14450 [Bacteroidetes bacterium]|nr:hypothetical protein [Bacteroidota bacterium]
MKKIVVLFFTILFQSSFAQIYTDCFQKLKFETSVFLAGLTNVAVGDTVDNIIEAMESRQKRAIGCAYPYSPVSTYDKKEINLVKFNTDYVIINFNKYYCDACLVELDYFVKLKKDKTKSLTVVVFLEEVTKEVEMVIDKYKSDIYFVTNAADYIKNHSLGAGKPLIYILDKNKNIIYAKSGTGKTFEQVSEVIK